MTRVAIVYDDRLFSENVICLYLSAVYILKKGCLIIPCLALLAVSCDQTQIDDTLPGILVSEQFNRSITQQQLASFWAFAGQPEAADYAVYDVDIYRIVYKTTAFDGSAIEASGAILVPKETVEPGLLSVQHATIFNNDEAPSVDRPGTISVTTRKALFASMGYITFLPDYLGYGATESMLHPYQHKNTLASASYDMILAGLEFIEKKNLTVSDYIVNMAGYSEGAYATLALAEFTSRINPPFETGLISMGAGIFNLSSTMDYLLTNIETMNECVACYAYFIYVFHTLYELPGTITQYFNSPYDEIVSAGLFEGDVSDSGLHSSLPGRTRELIRESFIEEYLNGGYEELRSALRENDIDFIPASPVIIAHGTADGVAPVFNSDQWHEKALLSGKTNSTYIRTEGATHTTAIFSWALETLNSLDRRNPQPLAARHE